MKNSFNPRPDNFDRHGNLKPHPMFWLCCLFLARAWIVFVIAGVSQNQGQTILSLIYPHQMSLYIGLAIGVPGVAFMLLAGNLHLYPRIFSSVWKHGRWILIAVFSADLLLQFKQLNLMHWRFELVSASLLTLTIWLQIYLFKSRRIQFLFESNINRIEKNE